MNRNLYIKNIIIYLVVLTLYGCSMGQTAYTTSPPQGQSDHLDLQPKTIAVIFPSQVIGKWGNDAINSVLGYLVYRNSNFDIKIFDTKNQSSDAIENTLDQVIDQGITKALILFTKEGAKKLRYISHISDLDIYLPLIHKKDLDLDISSVVYGAIDYTKQFNYLLKYSNTNIVNFYDNSSLGDKLSKNIQDTDYAIKLNKRINNNNGYYAKMIENLATKLTDSNFVINMPIVKTAIILSQINAKDIKPYNILSTQLNYTHLLLSLTQAHDRENIMIANSISKVDPSLEEYILLLNSDVKYNWVNYSSIIGIQYLLDDNIDDFQKVRLQNNQVIYPVELLTTTRFAFKKL